VLATLPDGRVGWLLWIKDWDFHWQDQYRYAQPLHLPRGTVLRMEFTYDNSAANRHNPRRTPQRVLYGGESTDEMGDVWLRLLPRAPEDAVTLARAYRENELRRDLAMAERRSAADPRDPGWRNRLGVAYVEAGRVPEAIAQLQEAIKLAPSHAEAHNNLGHALHLQRRLDEAIVEFSEAARLAPGSDLVELNLANALDEAGRSNEAVDHFRRAIALNPYAAEAHNNFGVALGSLGRLDEAEEHFRRALALRPDYADAQKNLDLVQELRGRT
jgi:Flp pilus assembly protein TadD